VRNLVERTFVQGDLGFGLPSLAVLMDGSSAHRGYQERQEESYEAEVAISHVYHSEWIDLTVHGRIDGIAHEGDDTVLEEIKSTHYDLALCGDGLAEHWAQARIYACMLCEKRGLTSIGIRLIYIHIPTGEMRVLEENRTLEELREELDGYLAHYFEWEDRIAAHEDQRDSHLEAMEFPFDSYRPGQRQMAADAFRAVRDHSQCVVEAPTGTGKTAAALFGALKGMAQQYSRKIFYLCSRTTIKEIASHTLSGMHEGGVSLRYCVLTAKQKCCPMDFERCNARHCPYAQGFFDRLEDAVREAFSLYCLDERTISDLSEKHRLCPFELSLSLAEISDVVICDYNYAFDPRVRLQRFFLDGGPYTLLVDEAHQLLDRARDMFSARISRKDVKKLRDQLPKGKVSGDAEKLRLLSREFYRVFREEEKNLGEELSRTAEIPNEEMAAICGRYCEEVSLMLESTMAYPWTAAAAELYFLSRAYLWTHKNFDECSRFLVQRAGKDTHFAILCLDPSGRLKEAYKKSASQIFFSATLSPQEYFLRLLGLDEVPIRHLPSPFASENLQVLVRTDISTSYRQRQESYQKAADAIFAFVQAKCGHYMVFFPSYSYLYTIRELFEEQHPEIPIRVQNQEMQEQERNDFLQEFREDTQNMLIAFAVMGGFFAEGIDLPGDALIGAVLVGVGVPQIGPERDLIRSYHDQLGEDGYRYAYQYPGFQRVLQAAGRVIRTPEDRGQLLLLDPRFVRRDYMELMPASWFPLQAPEDDVELKRLAEAFWKTS